MKKLTLILFCLIQLKAYSFHLVGGELSYNDLGNGKYRVTLKIYRDCNSSGSDFDGTLNGRPAYLTVYDAANNLEGLYDIGAPVIVRVPSVINSPCIVAPNNICVDEGVYTYTLVLPPKTGGYIIVYQSCCRNSIIDNLMKPASQGVTYFTKIPGPEDATLNSSARYSKFPPIYICCNKQFRFDHSATDPDGDKLVYSLCAPYAGLDPCCGSINQMFVQTGGLCEIPPAVCPTVAFPPPYANVQFAPPYSGGYPIDSNPAFSINPVTGELVGTPTLVGQYVVGVCVQEYRNNILLNTHFRDFQFTVIGCQFTALSSVADQKQKCMGNTLSFKNESTNTFSVPAYRWDFGVPGIASDTSNLFNPTYNYPDTGTYVITLVTNPGRPCTDTLKKTVYVYPTLKINFAHPPRQCFTNNSFNFSTAGVYIPQTTYTWDFGASAVPALSLLKDQPGVHFTAGGLFFVKLKARQFACIDSFIDSVRVIKKPVAKIIKPPDGLCDPARAEFINLSSSELPVKYHWKFSNGVTSGSFQPVLLFSPGGSYGATLTIQTTEVCQDTSVAVVTNILVNPRPKASFTFTPRETSIFEPDISFESQASADAIKTILYFGDGQSSAAAQVVHAYTSYGTYRITQTAMNKFGCIDSVSDILKILPEYRFWIPNCFTPDDNGRNDIFKPVVFGTVKYEFSVFDRWGSVIFSTTDPSEGWNGSLRGAFCQQGIYAWKVELENVVTGKPETHVGKVILLRSLEY